jgi:hypothetical protein
MTKLVTADNFNRAETDRYFAAAIGQAGDLGIFHHQRELASVDKQTVIRSNRDTLYSCAVFDLDAGPATVTVPDAGERYMSMMVIDRDQYTPAVFRRPGEYTLARKQFGTRYVMGVVRILVDPADQEDVRAGHALQDAFRIGQKGSGRFEAPDWDPASLKTVRNALLVLGNTVPDTRRMFGARGDVDPVRHVIGTAMGWGGNPEREALYLTVTPRANDGTTVHRLTVTEVPVAAFWSISVYNAQGYFEPNRYGVYTVNDLTAERESDGSVSVQFGGYDGKVANCIPVVPGWSYVVRLYRPRPEVLSYAWTFPVAEPVPTK